MKRIIVFLMILQPWLLLAQELKPYTVGLETNKSIQEIASELKVELKKNLFSIEGEYMPANDNDRYLIVYSHQELKSAAKKFGGLTGFALTQRIAITKEGNKTIVSYTSPEYWGNAYYRNDFDKVKNHYSSVNKSLEAIFKSMGNSNFSTFGSKKGLSAKDLRKYKYMMGMPEFHKTQKLAEFSSYEEAVNAIDNKFKNNNLDVKLVYSTELSGKKIKLYGVALNGKKGEAHFMSIIDISNPKHTAFLPYEFLVMDNEVHMLHGRYRIALSFPDLTMGTFTKIMSSPGDIKELIELIVK